MSKELNCMNCCIGDFKESLCDCNNGMCKEYKKVGRSEDFEKEVLKRTKPRAAEWIPVSESLPERGFGMHYLVTLKDGYGFKDDVYEAFFDNNGWLIGDNELADDEVIAWMPLPEPYKGGDTERMAKHDSSIMDYRSMRGNKSNTEHDTVSDGTERHGSKR